MSRSIGSGKWVFVANYGGGSVAAFPVQDDGKLGEASAFFQHAGSSVNKARQSGPHGHAVVVSPDNRFVLAADLGLDKVFAYRIDPKAGLVAGEPPFSAVAPGIGPAPPGDPARRQVRLRVERDAVLGRRVRLRRRPRDAGGAADALDVARRVHRGEQRGGDHRCTRPGSSSTRRTAATTASRSSASTRRRGR